MHYNNPYIELCLESSASVFRGLNQKDKDTIARHHKITNIKKGGYLFRENEKTKGLIFLASGKAKVFKTGVGGREQILRMIIPQEFIGYHAVFPDQTWSVSAAAIEDSVLFSIDKNSLAIILRNNGNLGLKFLRLITNELELSYNRTVSLTQKHVKGRVAESLLLLINSYGYEGDGKTIAAALTREDIAHLSSMTTSNAIRTLSTMASEGIIKMKGRKITITDKSSLDQISSVG
jgi:CRP/FNR family transcriptional regulator, polysaccharide utilization system transcription regulator